MERKDESEERRGKEIRDFIQFISTIWGSLATLTAIFPLSGKLFEVIPLPVDAYERSTAPIAIPLTTLVSLFVIFYSFVQRDNVIINQTRRAKIFFALGFVSLAIFFMLDQFWYPLRVWLCPERCDSTTDYRMWLVMLIPFYIAFFACVTCAFTMLALVEFKRRSTAAEGA